MNSEEHLLVTGGAGFIGSWFVKKILEKYPHIFITVIDSFTYAASIHRLNSVKKNALHLEIIKMDIRNYAHLEKIFKSGKFTRVIHFAAQTHVDRSIKEGLPFIETNIIGTWNLIELSRLYNIKQFIHISTDEVYGEIYQGYFKESDCLKPSSPYSASKAGADLLISSFIRTYKFPVVILRPSNNYGPWQHPEKFIPTVICNALLNNYIPVYGKGLNEREWLFVEDCVEGILKVVESNVKGGIYNIGSGCTYKNIEVAKLILDILNKPHSLIKFVEDRPGHDFRYALDSSKFIQEFKWSANKDLNEGLKITVKWFTENRWWWQPLLDVKQ